MSAEAMSRRLWTRLSAFAQPGTWQDKVAVPMVIVVLAGIGWGAWTVGLLRPVSHLLHCSGGDPGFPAWSPDGRSIAFGRTTSCGTRISLISLATGRISDLTAGTGDGQPAWSPNGREVTYLDGVDTRLLDFRTRTTRVLMGGLTEYGTTWSPNGRSIAYSHGVVGSPFDGGDRTTSVYIAAPDGANRRRLLGHDVNGGTPAWSPTGRELVVVGWNGVYIVNSDGSNLRRIVKESFDTPGTPAWSPDGGTIAFVGSNEIDLVDPSGQRVRKLVACVCDTQTDSASWSPDGAWIAYSAASGIYLIRPDGKQDHRIVRY